MGFRPGRNLNMAIEGVGIHLIVDFWGASHLADVEALGTAIRSAVRGSGATLLHLHLHPFGEGQGVTGVALLSESHISIHTWPEREYAALDVFMCGSSDPQLAVDTLQVHLKPSKVEVRRICRDGFCQKPG